MKKIYLLLILVLTSTTMFSQLIINEILYDPSNSGLDGDANGDGTYSQAEDEFMEFYNTGTGNLDVSGYTIYDAENLRLATPNHTVPANTLIPPGGAFVVFGGGTPTGTFGGAVVQTSTSGDMNMNNTGDTMYVYDAMGTLLLTFDIEPLSNNPNESYTRYPDITGAFIQHNDSTPLLFSPGTMVDGMPFNTVLVVSSITVQGQGGASTITTPGGTLQMEAMVLPAAAGDTTVTWSVANGTGTASIDAAGLLTAMSDGTVTVTATANDGSGVSGSAVITLSNQLVQVAAITVMGQGGDTAITTLMGTLQMIAMVQPANASDTTVTWSVTNGTGSATISSSGLLTADMNGVVTVTATANDGSGISGSTEITISGQNTGIDEVLANQTISLYPNPASNRVFIHSDERIERVELYSIDGKMISSEIPVDNAVDIQQLESGVYLLRVLSKDTWKTGRLIKE